MCLLYGGRLWFKCSYGTWKKCQLYGVSALERFCYKGFLRNLSGTKIFVRLRKLSVIEDIRFREVPLYLTKRRLLWDNNWFTVSINTVLISVNLPFFLTKACILVYIWFYLRRKWKGSLIKNYIYKRKLFSQCSFMMICCSLYSLCLKLLKKLFKRTSTKIRWF